MNDFHCPECKHKAAPLVIREPIDNSSTVGATTQMTTAYTFSCGPTYSPTQKTFKCINEKCWVSNIEIYWK